MKKLMMILAASVGGALVLPAAASAQGARTLFQCILRNGKMVSVTARGDVFSYRYGTPGGRADLVLRATPQTRTAFFLQGRYYAIATQVRFTSGAFSYIVHEIPSSTVADAQGTSGLMVMRGNQVVAERECRRLTEFRDWERLSHLPEDDNAWQAMSLER